MAITYGDHLINSGYYDITPEQEREFEAREECERLGVDPDEICADGGVTAWMVVDRERASGGTIKDFEAFLRRVPFTWHCVKCGKDFPDHPHSEQPFAFEVITNPETGWQTQGGNICRACHLGES